MPRFYLVRHGQTEWNAAGMYQGQMDIPLDETGRRQAIALRSRLSGVTFDAIYSSTLSRARETAALLITPEAGTTSAPALSRLAAFDEVSYGDWEGHTIEQIATLYAEGWRQYQNDPIAGRPPGGESRDDLRRRVVPAFAEIARAHAPDSQILLVTHGGTMRAIVIQMLGLELDAYRRLHFDNASLSIVDLCVPGPEFQPSDLRGSVVLLNDTAHLESLKALPYPQATPR